MEGHAARETPTADESGPDADGVQTGNACVVCWRAPTDRAHVIDRSLVPDPYADPLRIVYLCREHHDLYDDHKLDLLPYLEPRHRAELARAVSLFGLLATLERVTGLSWLPAGDPAPWVEANATLKHRVRELETELRGAEIVVNGKTVGYGTEGMTNALGAMFDA